MSVSASAPGLMQQRPFVLFWLARLAATMGYQMLALVIGWQIYQLTNSALDLGLVGLIQFVPAVVLTLLIGHAADRYDRRWIIRGAQSVYCACRADDHRGAADRRAQPRFVVRRRVPDRLRARLRSADRERAGAGSGAGAADHARGGGLDLGQPGGGHLRAGAGRADLCAEPGRGRRPLRRVLRRGAILRQLWSEAKGPVATREPPTFSSVLAGFDYIRTPPRLLGVITLDLFVVLLGGVTALLPIYARDILSVGPIGLGLLRSAPAAGALITAAVLSRHPVERHIGPKMFAVVAIYGARDHRVRAVELVSAVARGAGRARRLRRGQHRDPLLAGADRDARTPCADG